MSGKKLTIGMAVYNDYDGAYFSIQAIRMFHSEILDEIEFVIIDNCPTSKFGEELKKFAASVSEPMQYIPFNDYSSAFVKGKVFDYTRTPYVLVMDCHVMFVSGALRKLIDFYDSGRDFGNFLQGPLLFDNLKSTSTHFGLKWWGQMWGIWNTCRQGINPDGEPFEIVAQGMGVFSCRKENWLGFNPLFRGFGGEEGYIHKKYRKAGKKTLCLPFLKWLHRFGRPSGVPFRCVTEDRIKNHFIGFTELGLDTRPIYDHFISETKTTRETIEKWHAEVLALMCI